MSSFISFFFYFFFLFSIQFFLVGDNKQLFCDVKTSSSTLEKTLWGPRYFSPPTCRLSTEREKKAPKENLSHNQSFKCAAHKKCWARVAVISSWTLLISPLSSLFEGVLLFDFRFFLFCVFEDHYYNKPYARCVTEDSRGEDLWGFGN